MQTFEDLEVWKESCRLAVSVYETVGTSKDFGLKDQMQRAAVSIPSNIAEGYEQTNKRFIHHLEIAKGSAGELRTQIYIASKVGEISSEQATRLIQKTHSISRMLQSLINFRTDQIGETTAEYASHSSDLP